ncbi:MAG: hypothetical protein VXZ18_19485, partial [Pseudomonadota bacterium]|nr:hypothetical protein [Pseudomonadota bacterium]
RYNDDLEKFAFMKFMNLGDSSTLPETNEDLHEKLHFFPYYYREMKDIFLIKKSIVESLKEGDITKITDCLKSMGDTWGEEGTSGIPTSPTTTTTTTTTTSPSGQTQPSGTSTEATVSGDSLDLSEPLPEVPGKETLYNLIQSIQTYLMTISTPTSDPTIEKVKPFIYNIYRA